MTLTESAQAENRSQIYWFLSDLFLQQPTQTWLLKLKQHLQACSNVDSLDSGLANLSASLMLEGELEPLSQHLRIEHARLFAGISEGYGPPPPNESLHSEGQFMGPVTAAVTTHYREAGLGNLCTDEAVLDHLGTELRFMALLCYEQSLAQAAGDLSRSIEMNKRQRSFGAEHLFAWVPTYCKKLQQWSITPFYRAVASCTLDALELERTYLQLPSATVAQEVCGSDDR